MFGFALALNLNLHSGSCSVVLLNLTLNIVFGSGSNIVRNVQNRTVASLATRSVLDSFSTELPNLLGDLKGHK